MSIESEKEEILRLRFQEGLSLKEIAHKFGKSIYWVKSRLNAKYEPKRVRKVAADETDLGPLNELEGDGLSDEVKQIVNLRKQGLSYERIATKFGKSIYWIHSRLREKYRPRAKRRIAADDSALELPPELEDENLADEVKQIIGLRKEGLSYEQIADRLSRSVYWVHTRLRDEYRPKGASAEKIFQEERVIPFLKHIGHEDIRQFVRIKGYGYDQEADIVSVFEHSTWVTEVKTQISHHELQTAIGQLILHRMAFSESNRPKLQIALPSETDRIKMSKSLIDLLKENEDISVLFIP